MLKHDLLELETQNSNLRKELLSLRNGSLKNEMWRLCEELEWTRRKLEDSLQRQKHLEDERQCMEHDQEAEHIGCAHQIEDLELEVKQLRSENEALKSPQSRSTKVAKCDEDVKQQCSIKGSNTTRSEQDLTAPATIISSRAAWPEPADDGHCVMFKYNPPSSISQHRAIGQPPQLDVKPPPSSSMNFSPLGGYPVPTERALLRLSMCAYYNR